MKYFFGFIFCILLLVYMLSHLIINRTKRKKYAFFLSEIFFLLSGHVLAMIFKDMIKGSFLNYLNILSIILITIISYTTSLQFRNRIIKRIPLPFITMSAAGITLFSLISYVLWGIFVNSWSIHNIMLGVFLSGISFTFVDVRSSGQMRRITMAGLLSPMIYTVFWIVITAISLIAGLSIFNVYIFVFIGSAVIIVLLLNYLSVTLPFNEWTISVIAVMMIVTSFSTHLGIPPLLVVFIIGYFITNRSITFSDRFFRRFAASEKPAYFLLLIIAGAFMTVNIYYMLAAIILVILKMLFFSMFFGSIFKSRIKSLAAVGISGFEFIGCLSLYLLNLIDSSALAFFIVFMIISQIIQMAVIYADDTK